MILLPFNFQYLDNPSINFESHPFTILISTGWSFVGSTFLFTSPFASFFSATFSGSGFDWIPSFFISMISSLVNNVDCDYSTLSIAPFSILVSGNLQLMWEYLTLSCWSHCILFGIRGTIGIVCSLLGSILSSIPNNLDELPFICVLLNGNSAISRFIVSLLPKFTSSFLQRLTVIGSFSPLVFGLLSINFCFYVGG